MCRSRCLFGRGLALALILSLAPGAARKLAAADDDILIADFEGESYGDWKTTGEAFGKGPAQGTLPGQMHVSGFRGKGLVNSFLGGDGTTGTLSSPPLRLERRYLSFLIGGGGHEGKTCLNLLLDGEIVRSATGPNLESGGTEALEAGGWDCADLLGKTVTLQIVDDATGGWGHINVDHIVQTSTKPALPARLEPRSREIALERRFLLFPIRGGAPQAHVDLNVDGVNVREFSAELALTRDEAKFWSFLDVSAFQGKRATLRLSRASDESIALVEPSDSVPAPEDLYDEPLRPQLRFSQRLGWNNDPNGMVFHKGEWHLYFQHNPYGWRWGNMHWGHAVSKDLVHWEQLPIAIYNARRGDWAFSGGAVVDEKNTAGWQTGDDPVIVASWTSTGRGECLAYSTDRGRTFTEFEGNPVIRHSGRDPKIIWYEPGQHWVLAVYSEHEKQRSIAFYTSKNLKEWELASRLDGYYECPEIFELPVDGDPAQRLWAVFAADARYALGHFDGRVFTPLHEGKHRVHHGSYYASQTFSNAPEGRRIQIGWARIDLPGMPFNQAFTLPHELTLRSTEDGVRLFAEPVAELDSLSRTRHVVEGRDVAPDAGLGVAVEGELFDIRAVFEPRDAKRVGLDIGGNRIVYDVATRKLQDAELSLVDGRVEIRAVVDRPMLEIVGNRGRVYITGARKSRGEVASIETFAEGGAARLVRLEVRELESIWRELRARQKTRRD